MTTRRRLARATVFLLVLGATSVAAQPQPGTAVFSAVQIRSAAADALDVAGGIQAGSGNVPLVGADGRIPAIDATRFASLSGANLTALNATQLTSGIVPDARISGSYTGFTNISNSGGATFGDRIQVTAGASGQPALIAVSQPTTAGGIQIQGRASDNVGRLDFVSNGAASGQLFFQSSAANATFGHSGVTLGNINNSGRQLVLDRAGDSGLQIVGNAKIYGLSVSNVGDDLRIQDDADADPSIQLTTNALAITATGGITLFGNTSVNGNASIGGRVLASDDIGGGYTFSATTATGMFRNSSTGGLDFHVGELQMFSVLPSGAARFAQISTTAAAANAVLDAGNNNSLLRSTSSRSAKTSIEPLSLEAARLVLQLQPVTYRGIHDYDDRLWAGFIAEDVAAVDPTLVTFGSDGQPNYVTYDRVPAYLLRVLQDVVLRLEQLETATRGR